MKTLLLALLLALSTNAADWTLFHRTNLVAWCIVPFDAKKREPEERAEMLEKLGFRKEAYDWRAEHIPQFQAEVDALKKRNIEFTAWWFPTTLDETAKQILAVIEKNKIQPQLWVMGSGNTVEGEVARLKPIVEAAKKFGCKVGLYNHGGWFGQPENQVAIIKALGADNVGIVYNFHHGHEHIDRFAELFALMKPHLLCVNINGMVKDGDKIGKKILTIGAGNREKAMFDVIANSGWRGPVGIIDHREETDSEQTLRENLEGLERLLKK